jgi:putative hydrolase of the HAD superfamily
VSLPLKALLLDAFGTVIRASVPVPGTYVRIAAQHGIVRTLPDVARALAATPAGPPPLQGIALADVPAREREGWRAFVRAVLGDEAADGPCFDAIFAHFARADAWRLVPGLSDALEVARGHGLRCAVVSNMDARLPGILDGLGIASAFETLVLPSTCGFAKPDPRIFGVALERLGVGPDAVLYVGDREPDCVEAARLAGLEAWRLDPEAETGGLETLSGWGELAPRLANFARDRRSG